MDNIQWYPGHMTKALRMMKESLNLVDVVIEILDARIPMSSKNPDIDELAKNKKRIVVLNKSDLASEAGCEAWKRHYESLGFYVVISNANARHGLKEISKITKSLMAEKVARAKAKGRLIVPIRAMIAGIPNSGKSTIINRYAGKKMAKVADKPGVTRNKQWITIGTDFELLDTPGILWPKVEGGINLAITGAINDNILDLEELTLKFITFMMEHHKGNLENRYKIQISNEDTPLDIFERIGRVRGFKIKDDNIDYKKTAVIILDEFRAGRLGRITLEMPPAAEADQDG